MSGEQDPILQAIGFLRDDVKELRGEADDRHKSNEHRLDEGALLMGELSQGVRELNDREKERNGKIARHEAWIEGRKLQLAVEAATRVENERLKREARGIVSTIWKRIETPVMLGLGLGVMATVTLIGVSVWDALEGRPW